MSSPLQAADPERYQALYAQAQAQLVAAHPKIGRFLRGNPGSSLHHGAIRARMKDFLGVATGLAAE